MVKVDIAMTVSTCCWGNCRGRGTGLPKTAGLTQTVTGAQMRQSCDIRRQDEQRLGSQGWRSDEAARAGRVFYVVVVAIGLGEVVAVHDGMKKGYTAKEEYRGGGKPLQDAVGRGAAWG